MVNYCTFVILALLTRHFVLNMIGIYIKLTEHGGTAMQKSQRRVFIDFVFTYFTIIILALICLFPVYISLARAERDKAAQMILDYGQSSLRELESEENRLFHTVRNFYMDRDFKKLYYSDDQITEAEIFYSMTQLQEKLKLYFQNIDAVRGVFVYIPKFDYVLTQKYTFRSRSQFYASNQFDSFAKEDWLNQLCTPEYNMTRNSGQFTDLLDAEETYSVMNLFFTFPMAGDSNVKILVMVSLDSQAAANQLLLPDIQGQSYAIITDKEGTILAQSEPSMGEFLAPDREYSYQLIHIQDSSTKNVIIGVNHQYYRTIRAKTLWLILSSIGAALLISACAALYFAWNRSRPLEHVLAIIRQANISKNRHRGLEDLEDTVVGMVSEIRQCKGTIKELDTMVSHNLLERLFFGELIPGKLEDAFIQYYGPMPSPCVSVVFLRESNEQDALLLQEDVLSELLNMGLYIYVSHLHKNRVYLLLPDTSDIQDTLALLLKNLRERGGKIVKAGISNSITGLQAVKEGTLQAQRRLDAGYHIQGVYLFTHTYSSRGSLHLLNVQLLDALQRALLTGNRQLSDKIIHDIFEHVQPEKPDAVELRQLFFSLRSVYSAVISQFSLEAEKSEEEVCECLPLPNDLEEYSPLSVQKAFMDLNRIIDDYYQQQLARNKRIKGFDILTYVEEQFKDPNLCASSIASKFHISEKYVFQLMKGASGETLNDKISFLRVQEAIRLLEHTSLTVSEIALRSGFTSSNSMYKVFMRVKGVPPSTFRKK